MKYCKPISRPVLSIDVGKKRVGLAYCDALHITVSILPAIKRTENLNELNLIKRHIIQHNLVGIVV